MRELRDASRKLLEVIVLRHVKHLVLGLIFVAAVLLVTSCSALPTAWPSLAADGEAVYVTLLDGKIHVLNPDNGSKIWSFPDEPARSGLGCSGPAKPETGLFYASPVLAQDIVFIGSDVGRVYALDKTNNGIQRWAFISQQETKGGLLGLFAEKKNLSIVGSPTLDDETLYIPSAGQGLYAVDATNGTKLWDFQTDDAIWASPLVTQDRIYVAVMNHKLYCLDKESRTELWAFDAEGAIPSAPALADDTIYLASLARQAFAIDANTGQQRWSFEMDSWAWATPLVVSDAVYVSEINGTLFALDAETGGERWHFDTQGKIQATPAYANDTLYLASEDTNLYALDAATGVQKWQFTASAALVSTPVLVDDTLYVVGMNNNVYALNAESGTQKWVYDPTPEN
jgi:outer membrane protein assembly factor BamB